MKKSNSIKNFLNQSGQVTVEFVLITVVLVGLTIFVQKKLFQEGEFFAQFLTGPWGLVAGMAENGVWKNPDAGRKLHPGSFERHRSLKGETE